MKRLINEMSDVRVKKDQVKFELAKLENKKYAEWKVENPTARTAMDKVLAELKSTDEKWQNKELYYVDLSNQLSYLTNIYNIVQGMVSNPNYNKEDVQVFMSGFTF